MNAISTSKERKRPPLNRRLSFWLVLLVIIILIGCFRWQRSSTKAEHGPAPSPVVVAQAKISDVPIYLMGLGGVTPTYSVTVQTQINGTLLKVLFKEGQMVKVGDPLADIDATPYQALLEQYQGQLLRDQALLANALTDLKRYQLLWKQDSISQQVLATQQSLVRQYQGTVLNDQGLIQGAKISIGYCHITSPINGRVGLRLVDPGNFVQTGNSTGIAVINMLNPITAIFTIPEDNIPDVMPRLFSGKTMKVEAYDRQQNTLLAKGKTITIDNQVDPATGTVKIKAQFQNDTNKLYPSQFVNIKMLVKTLHKVVIVPTAAIQFSNKGSYVFIVKDISPAAKATKKKSKATADKTTETKMVSMQTIVPGVATGDNTVITSGLSAGQTVVIEGADKLTDGAEVTVGPPAKGEIPKANNSPLALQMKKGGLRRSLSEVEVG